jgi:hypothetical protein
MIVLAAIIPVTALSLLAVLTGLRKAPEGYEDEQGFHLIRKRAGGAAVVGRARYAGVYRSKSALKRAEANV